MNQLPDISRFIETAQGVSAQVLQAPDMAGALARALVLAGEHGGAVAAAGLDPQDSEALARLCAGSQVELIEGDLRQQAGQLAVGITPALFGIAETGTLVVDSTDEDLRLCSMLPAMHIALLPADSVYPDMDAIADKLAQLTARSPGYLAFITGPSRTADIERELTIGVHGPAELTILLHGEAVS